MPGMRGVERGRGECEVQREQPGPPRPWRTHTPATLAPCDCVSRAWVMGGPVSPHMPRWSLSKHLFYNTIAALSVSVVTASIH